MKKHLFWIIPLAVIGFVVMTLVGYYNRFVMMGQLVDGQWAQVETQYQRRFDLIPNLVNSTKGFMEQEQEVFGKIAEARTRYAGAQTVNDKAAAATQVESALGRLLVIMENYPQLKSNETVRQLMDELAGTENRIAVERRRYNDGVRNYNTGVTLIPGKFFAGLFGFGPREYFQSVEGSEVAPKVEL
jgi:LemA protein